ncbi:MAG: hypothetical protein DMF89_11855 [Acidobacteria bacterium]|nr:MAG: hypothetical protein DMF89_11855 [Acidobacteriota bacterium]
MTRIRSVTAADADAWGRMRLALWPEGSFSDHQVAIEQYLAGHRHEPQEVLLAVTEANVPVGVAELSIRNIVDGCRTDRVAYLEGWYVTPDARRQGVGRALVEAAETWAINQGCVELGSDTSIENVVSHSAHRALGFVETGQLRAFRKDLVVPAPSTGHPLSHAHAIDPFSGTFKGDGTWHDAAGKSSSYRVVQTNAATSDGFDVTFRHDFDDGSVVDARFAMTWIAPHVFRLEVPGAPGGNGPIGNGYVFGGYCHYHMRVGESFVEASYRATGDALEVFGSSTRNAEGLYIAWRETLRRD